MYIYMEVRVEYKKKKNKQEEEEEVEVENNLAVEERVTKSGCQSHQHCWSNFISVSDSSLRHFTIGFSNFIPQIVYNSYHFVNLQLFQRIGWIQSREFR